MAREKGQPHALTREEPQGQDQRGSPRSLPRWLALAGLVLVNLALALWGIDHGLPRVYNPDERLHFVPKAVDFFGTGDLDPDYYLNPPGFTYLLYGVYWAWFRSGANVLAAEWKELFLVGRVTAAMLGGLAVVLVYAVGKRLFDTRVGLAAAAVMAVAFLPVYQAKLALNDVPVLVPVCLALLGAAGILRSGRWLDYALAGAGVGLAIGTKYTAGMVLAPAATAAVIDLIRRRGRAIPAIGTGIFCAVAGFAIAVPYSVLDPPKFFESLGVFSVSPPESRKLGQENVNGILQYLWVFTWGLGWLPSLTAVGGAVAMVRRNLVTSAILIPGPVLFILFMGIRGGFLSRYMLPAFPFLALLAAYGLSEFARAISGGRIRVMTGVILVGALALMAQSVIHDVHIGLVHTKKNTREIALRWMRANIPERAAVAIEPFYISPRDPPSASHPREDPAERSPWRLYPWDPDYLPSLEPGILDEFEERGVCWVVIGHTQRGRASNEPRRLADAIAFYDELEERGDLVHEVSPYTQGADPVPFDFDWSINHYPLAYERPGLEIDVYRLRAGGCS